MMKQSIKNLIFMIILISISSVLSSCINSGSGSSGTLNTTQSSDLKIDKSSSIPVLDGNPTTTGIYIHNTTNHAISGISYQVLNSSASSHLTINQSSCTTIKANSSCLLSITTPSVKPLSGGGDVIIANYNGTQSSQMINYNYVDSSSYNGVTFASANVELIGRRDYATVYAFVGSGQSANNVSFKSSNNSVGVVNGLTNGGTSIGANQVLPLEVVSSDNITAMNVSILPISDSTQGSKSKQYLQSANNNLLQVAIVPTTTSPNLIMSNVGVLTQDNPEVTVTVYNSGNSIANNINLNSSSLNISVIDGDNPCSNNVIPAGNSCNYVLRLDTTLYSGSDTLNLVYNGTPKQMTVYYQNLAGAPMVGVSPATSQVIVATSSTESFVFNVRNYGIRALNNPVITPISQVTGTTLTETSNDCGSDIEPNETCRVITSIVAGGSSDNGMMYLNISGIDSNNSTYSFMSLPVNVTLIDLPPKLVSTTPSNTESNVSQATGITLNFNEPMTVLTLSTSNIQLLRESDDVAIALTSQGVTNNNQTVSFNQSNGRLDEFISYKVVINPSAITDSNGVAMDSGVTESIVAVFTTGDSIAPTITGFVPSDGSGGISQTPAMTIQFSESMDPSTLTTSSIMLRDNGVLFNDYTINYDITTYMATLVLINGAELSDKITYEIRLNQDVIKDSTGNKLGMNTDYLLTTFTVGDIVIPELISTTPLNGANDVSIKTNISLTFSESMDTSTLTNTNIKLYNESRASYTTLDNVVYSNENKTVTLTPIANLELEESYSIVINPSQIKDLAENPLGAAVESKIATFKTDAGFYVKSTYPSNNGLVGSDTTFITITFSKPVDISTVNSMSVVLVESETVLPNYIGVCELVNTTTAKCNLGDELKNNIAYQLTIGTSIKSLSDENLLSSSDVLFSTIYISPQQRLASGSSYACMLNQFGQAYCWGDNTRGSLGTGNNTSVDTPTLVKQGEIPLNTPIIAISAGTALRGYGTSCAIAANARAYCWGDNGNYAVGNGTTTPDNYNTPKAIATKDTDSRSAIPANTRLLAIDSTNVMACALDNTGQAYCWGNVTPSNTSGYLGDESGTQSSSVPIKVDQSTSGAFIQISVGGGSACAINESHDAYCWGGNAYGQLGSNGTTSQKTPTKVSAGQIPESVNFSFISIGKDNSADSAVASCAIASNNQAYCWGSNNYGQLGINTTSDNATNRTPRQVFTDADNINSEISSTESLVSISAGSRSNCAIGVTGIGYCWGANNFGQLGINSTTNSSVAKKVSTVTGFLSLITGYDNIPGREPALSCGLSVEENFYCWGKNNLGQVGIGTTGGQYTTPQQLTIPD